MEAGEVGQGSVVVGHILAGVRVSHRDEVDVHAVCLHGLAQGGQTLGNGIHAHVKKPSFFILPEKRPAAMVCRVYCIILRHRMQFMGGVLTFRVFPCMLGSEALYRMEAFSWYFPSSCSSALSSVLASTI